MQFVKRLGIGAALIAGLAAVGCGDSPTSYKEESLYSSQETRTGSKDKAYMSGLMQRVKHGDYQAAGELMEYVKGPQPAAKPAQESLPLQSVTDVYTGEPVRAVMDIDGELYWTPPIIRSETRRRIAAKPTTGAPRIQIDGGDKYYDVDTYDAINGVQLVPKHTSEFGEDLMFAMRMTNGGRFPDGTINVYLENPPSQAHADSAVAGIMSWQEATDRVAGQMGVPNRFGVRMVDRETRPGVVVRFEGQTRGDGRSNPIGVYASDEDIRDEFGRPLMAYVYVNPTAMRPEGVVGVAGHEFGHAAIPMNAGYGYSPYDGGHLPYAGPNNDNLMASIPYVNRPSDFEALITIVNYSLDATVIPYIVYAETDTQIDPPLGSPDMDGNGAVDFDDFFRFADVFGTTAIEGDLSNDGFVGFDDFFRFADAFGKSGTQLEQYAVSQKDREDYLNGTQ